MTPQKLKERQSADFAKVECALKKLFPHAKIELNYETPLQLLVAVQLCAQCTDKMVNKITDKLI